MKLTILCLSIFTKWLGKEGSCWLDMAGQVSWFVPAVKRQKGKIKTQAVFVHDISVNECQSSYAVHIILLWRRRSILYWNTSGRSPSRASMWNSTHSDQRRVCVLFFFFLCRNETVEMFGQCGLFCIQFRFLYTCYLSTSLPVSVHRCVRSSEPYVQ